MKKDSKRNRKDYYNNNDERNKRLDRLKPEFRNKIKEKKRSNKREERLNNVPKFSRSSARPKKLSMNR